MLEIYPRCSRRLASDVRVYADSPVLEKPVEDGFGHSYNYIDTDDDADEDYEDDDGDEDCDVGDEEEPVENGGGR